MNFIPIQIFVITVLSTVSPETEHVETGYIIGKNLFETFLKGGIFMWPILLCSVIGVAFALERMIALRRTVVFPSKLLHEVKTLAQERKLQDIIKLCEANNSVFARMLLACLKKVHSSAFEIEATLESAGSRALLELRTNTKALGVIADVAPLLGLLGTVQGMIMAFDVVAKTGALGRAEKLAESIAVALLTTAFGLLVAVPSVIFYHYFRARAEALLKSIGEACLEIIELFSTVGDKNKK